MSASEPPAITLARRAYNAAGDLLDHRTADRETTKQGLADALARMEKADEAWNSAASAVDKTFQVLRDLVAEWHAAGDPPDYDPYDDAADQAEDHAAAQRELAAIEAEEAHDAAGKAWDLGRYGEGGTS